MRQFLSLVCLLSIYITAVSGSVDFYCFEEGIKINCTDRKEVDLYDFDNSITDFNSNRYYTNTYSDGFTAIFFDITAYSTDINIDSETGSVTFSGEDNYETIYIINIESTSEGAGNTVSGANFRFGCRFNWTISGIESCRTEVWGHLIATATHQGGFFGC